MRRPIPLLPLVAALMAVGMPVRADDAPDELRERVIAMRPPAERWQEIPWETDLVRAREKAAETGRPIFLWAMNGNPLGCT